MPHGSSVGQNDCHGAVDGCWKLCRLVIGALLSRDSAGQGCEDPGIWLPWFSPYGSFSSKDLQQRVLRPEEDSYILHPASCRFTCIPHACSPHEEQCGGIIPGNIDPRRVPQYHCRVGSKSEIARPADRCCVDLRDTSQLQRWWPLPPCCHSHPETTV